MNFIQPIINYGLFLIIADVVAFRASKKPIKEVMRDEMVSRFITKSSEYHNKPSNVNYLQLKHTAFLPHSRIELSVFRISGIYDNLIWKLGMTVAKLRDKELIGRGDIKVDAIITSQPVDNQFAKRLTVKPAPLPLSHADIAGYPSSSESKIQKAAQKQFALELAIKASKLIKVPA